MRRGMGGRGMQRENRRIREGEGDLNYLNRGCGTLYPAKVTRGD